MVLPLIVLFVGLPLYNEELPLIHTAAVGPGLPLRVYMRHFSTVL